MFNPRNSVVLATALFPESTLNWGVMRIIPLIYIADGDRFIIAAANSGSDQHPTWWLNLRHSQEALVQVMRVKTSVRARVAAPHERAHYWTQLVAMYPYFTAYQARTQREIPVVILEPVETS